MTLTGTTAAKVKAAALAKLPVATVLRVEKDGDGAVYEAHLTKTDGTHVTVKLDVGFSVTAVETGGPGDALDVSVRRVENRATPSLRPSTTCPTSTSCSHR